MDYIPHQAPLFMEVSRQEHWSGLSFPSPKDLPSPGIKAWSPALQTDFFTIWATRETHHFHVELKKHYELVNKIKKQQTHKYREQTSVDHWEGGGQCKRGEEKRKKG